jgi:hypothetical protein
MVALWGPSDVIGGAIIGAGAPRTVWGPERLNVVAMWGRSASICGCEFGAGAP